MALQANAVFTFVGFDLNSDGSVALHLTCAQPGPNLPGAYTVTLTPVDITTIQGAGTQAQQIASLGNIVKAYLIAQYRPSVVIANALSGLIGQTLTV